MPPTGLKLRALPLGQRQKDYTDDPVRRLSVRIDRCRKKLIPTNFGTSSLLTARSAQVRGRFLSAPMAGHLINERSARTAAKLLWQA